MSDTQQGDWRRGGPGLKPIDRVGYWKRKGFDDCIYIVESLDPGSAVFYRNIGTTDARRTAQRLCDWQNSDSDEWSFLGPLPGEPEPKKGDREAKPRPDCEGWWFVHRREGRGWWTGFRIIREGRDLIADRHGQQPIANYLKAGDEWYGPLPDPLAADTSAALADAVCEAAALRAELDETVAALAEARAEIESLRTDCAMINGLYSKWKERLPEVIGELGDIASLAAERDRLTTELRQMTAHADDWRAEAARFVAERDALKVENERLRNEQSWRDDNRIADFATEKAELEDEIKRLREQPRLQWHYCLHGVPKPYPGVACSNCSNGASQTFEPAVELVALRSRLTAAEAKVEELTKERDDWERAANEFQKSGTAGCYREAHDLLTQYGATTEFKGNIRARITDLGGKYQKALARLSLTKPHPFPEEFDALDVANQRIKSLEKDIKTLHEELSDPRIIAALSSAPSESGDALPLDRDEAIRRLWAMAAGQRDQIEDLQERMREVEDTANVS